MKLSHFLFPVVLSAACAEAAPNPLPDPAADFRLAASITRFSNEKASYESFRSSGDLLDGNLATALQFSAGQYRLLVKLPDVKGVQSIAIIGSAARISVSVAAGEIAPGTGWETVSKNARTAATWGAESPVGRTTRYLLIEAESRTPFTLSEIAVYSDPAPVLEGPKTLLEALRTRRENRAQGDTLEPIHAGPQASRGYIPGKLGFPPRMSDSGLRAKPGPLPPRGRISTPPQPVR